MNKKQRYVLMVVTSPNGQWAVGITKKRGPVFLIGKICFPGGKIEGSEAPAFAASREMLEETGLAIPVEAWTSLRTVIEDDFELYVYFATCENVFFARQLEDEPVWHLAVPRHQEYAKSQPLQYAPDFLSDLQLALENLTIHKEVIAL